MYYCPQVVHRSQSSFQRQKDTPEYHFVLRIYVRGVKRGKAGLALMRHHLFGGQFQTDLPSLEALITYLRASASGFFSEGGNGPTHSIGPPKSFIIWPLSTRRNNPGCVSTPVESSARLKKIKLAFKARARERGTVEKFAEPARVNY